MKITFYRLYYSMLNRLSNIVDNRKLIKYKIMIGTTLLFLTSSAHSQIPKKNNKEDKEKQDTILSDSIIHPTDTIEEDVMCYIPAIEPLDSYLNDPDGPVYEYTTENPEFPGGWDKLDEFIKTNFVNPPKLKRSARKERVIIHFIIEKDGSITNTEVFKSVHPAMDQAALDVINKMPKWTPGKVRGEIVRVKFALPVEYLKSKRHNN